MRIPEGASTGRAEDHVLTDRPSGGRAATPDFESAHFGTGVKIEFPTRPASRRKWTAFLSRIRGIFRKFAAEQARRRVLLRTGS
jgi:hypothetical protein